MRTSGAVCSACSSGEAAPSLACWQSLKDRQRRGWLHNERGAQVHPKWELWAWGSCGGAPTRCCNPWGSLGEHTWLSLVGAELEAEAEIREAGSYWPSLGLLLQGLRNTWPRKNLHRNLQGSILLITTKRWKQPKCPSPDEQISQMWCICIMQYYLAIRGSETLPRCNIGET